MNSVNPTSCSRPGKNRDELYEKWKKLLDGGVLAAPEASMSDGLIVTLDGEAVGILPETFQVLPEALKFVT